MIDKNITIMINIKQSNQSMIKKAMSVVMALLLLQGRQLAEVRAEALATLQRGLGARDGATLPDFISAGGLFVLLSLLSPSTRMDGSPEVHII